MPQYPSMIDLSTLNGTNGFRLTGIDAADRSGVSVASVGDINGDGFDDFVIGSSQADPNGLDAAGETYVVFGAASGWDAAFSLADLNGTNGFRLDGVNALGSSGWSVASAGDVNGDGFDDLIIGGANLGHSYLVFGGPSGWGGAFDLSALNGTNGFRLDGAGFSAASAGDVNGDGFDDLIIGSHTADPSGRLNAGETYVVFGAATGWSATFDLASLNGSNGFRIEGMFAGDNLGWSVASAGDVNNDGFDDLIIGAPGADPGGDSSAGETYIVFGAAGGWSAAFDLFTLNGANGFRIYGVDFSDASGRSVASAGDINGDGFADIIIGAIGGDPGGRNLAGESYVVFGAASGWGAFLDLALLNGTNGFRIDGINANDSLGYRVASAGDFNGDGFDDIVIGAVGAGVTAGETYVVFGAAGGWSATIDLVSLNGNNGFRIGGINPGDESGYGVASAGDINGDGFSDIIIGAPGADPDGVSNAGESYVIFGGPPGEAVTRTGTDIANTIHGGAFNDTLYGLGGNDVLYGNAGDDYLDGGAGNDQMFGGDGNDIIIYDSADTPANVQGGAGFDLLVFLSGSAPTHFNLVAQGFEGAEGRLTDTGNTQDWTTRTLVYDVQWRLDTETTYFDNGSRAFHDFDQTNVHPWASEWTLYDAADRLDVVVTTFDDGSYSNNNHDQDDSFIWSSEWTRYDGLGRVDVIVTTFDDATYSINEFDVAEAQPWVTQWTRYDALGRVEVVFTTFDDGSYSINEFDVAGTQPWVTQWTRYDALNRVDTVATTFDDGTYSILDNDEADAFDWASMWWLYNAEGQVIQFVGTNDDGSFF